MWVVVKIRVFALRGLCEAAPGFERGPFFFYHPPGCDQPPLKEWQEPHSDDKHPYR